MSQKHVLIIGGGVAGLTAAHELIERGYKVTVLEPHARIGGKSKSLEVAHSGKNGRKNLPGEHGFRFFPGFYRHLPDTMARIPYKNGTVHDNLLCTKEIYMGSDIYESVTVRNGLRGTFGQMCSLLSGKHSLQRSGVLDEEIDFFLARIWEVLTYCRSRRDAELDSLSWWEFTKADTYSPAYRQHMVIDSTKTLVASDPQRASTRTIGQIAIQVFKDLFRVDGNADRVLNGPTNDVWMHPWHIYLSRKGVEFKTRCEATALHHDGAKITDVTHTTATTQEETLVADYYILATPVEISSDLLSSLQRYDNQFKNIRQLAKMTNWMNGIQFYLKKDVRIVYGHEMLSTTAWALTSISQAQFWSEAKLATMGDGTVHGVLSVDISDWHTKGVLHKKKAINCTPKEIAEEVWFQLKGVLNRPDEVLLEDENLHSWFLDPDIQCAHKNPHKNINLEPLLVNLVNSWQLRPTVTTKVPNLFLAADYVKNNTDLATMEGANEAARRAVNALLDTDRSNARRCAVWPLQEPLLARPFQWYDQYRFNRGLSWNPRPPLILRWPVVLLVSSYRTLRFIAQFGRTARS